MDDTGLRCIVCEYNLTGAPGPRCPECGWQIDWERVAGSDAGWGGQPVFSVDFACRLGGSHFVATLVDDFPPIPPQLEALVEETWQARLRAAAAGGQHLYDGPMLRLSRWTVEGNQYRLDIGRTDYRHFLGTNFAHGDRAAEFGVESYSNALGVSALVCTADGYLLMGRRRPDLPCHGGFLHPAGGVLDAGDVDEAGQVHLFNGIRRELAEELHLTGDDIDELVCTGLIRDITIRQPELIFDALVRVDRDELVRRHAPDAPGEEHSRLEACLDDPDSVVPFIRRAEQIAPIAVGCLLMHGRQDWGLDWYENASLVLFGQLPPKSRR